ncbi:hypothetical protein PO878_00730 [Iamia majanohamensis]|uniref:Uncharacterized protein n=1 Tax=Iamia majanohamensis TaxID=467976 RepID=A0AAE9Y7R2_9ACTN|nr:hypothetical protein [Iamia majanohamensis]WCO67246.1 hypothetical protein PO878_00730 [Iamia majanohamensis]
MTPIDTDRQSAAGIPPASPGDVGWNVYGEGWDPSFGTSADFEVDGSADVELVEPGRGPIERSPAQPVPLAFVDGVRRAELSLWAEHSVTGDRIPGLAGAYGVGAVVIRPGAPARYAGIRVGRIAVWGGGHSGDIASRVGYRWASAPIAGTDPDECLAHLQDRMRRAEGELAIEAADAGWNVVLDGPLNRLWPPGLVAGYVKSHHRRILPEGAHAAVPGLGIGDRTRLYSVGSQRYTCYVRIGHPATGASPWSGIARLEFAASAGLQEVISRATLLSSLLPAHAGAHHRDQRAPVNLTPVKSLEHRLAKALGSVAMATRAARDAITSGARR